MNSPFSDVPAQGHQYSPQRHPNQTSNPQRDFSVPNSPSSHPERPVDLSSLASRIGLLSPSQPSPSQHPRNEFIVTEIASGDSFVSALLNGQTNISSDADFILNICNQEDLLITDETLVKQFKSKGIPRSCSALLDQLESFSSFKKLRQNFETQLKSTSGPVLTNAVNKLIGDIVSLLHPSAKTVLRMIIIIMAQYRGKEHKTTQHHIISCRLVHFWKIFIWTHEDDLISVLDTLSNRRDPSVKIPTDIPYQNAPGYSRMNTDFYASSNSIALVTKIMLMYTIKPTVAKLDPTHLRDRLLIQKRQGHPMIMTNNDSESWLMHHKNDLQSLI